MKLLSGAFTKIQTNNTIYKLDDYWDNYLLPFSMTEYISCKIAEQLGMDVQEVDYGVYGDFSACKIKMFNGNLMPLQGISSMSFNMLNTPNKSLNNNRFELLIKLIESGTFKNFYLKQENYIERLLNLVIIDTITLNNDRHFGNIALLENKGIVELSPIYDLASTFFISEFFSNKECKLNKFKYQYRINGKKITILKFYNTYKEFLDRYKLYINNKLNMASKLNIKEIIESVKEININNTAILADNKDAYISKCYKYLDFIENIFYKAVEYMKEIYLNNSSSTSDVTGGNFLWKN